MFDANYLNKLREKNPLILNITNQVVINFVANGLLAVGASPIMSSAKEEIRQLVQICSAVSINIGTLTKDQLDLMLIAADAANEFNKPLILDPVGVGATDFRQEAVAKLLRSAKFSAIRGNAGEMAKLAGVQWQSKGVDAGTGSQNLSQIAQIVAKKYQTLVLLSGATDIISDGEKSIYVNNGTKLFEQITGAGCLQGAFCAAFLAVCENSLVALSTAALAYSISGEIAATKSRASGTFATNFLDELTHLSANSIEEFAKITIENRS